MLWGLAAAGAPLVIHLLSRRRFQETPWAAQEYLLAAVEESRRRLQLERWLLLLLRTLLIVLVVAALAQPGVQDTAAAPAESQKTHHVFLLDASYSMAYQTTDKTRFDRARELISQIVQEAPEGDGFSLVLMGDRARIVVGAPAYSRDDFLREVEPLELAHGGANLAKALDAVETALATARRESRRFDRRELRLLSDRQRVTWDLERLDKGARDELQRQVRRLAKSVDAVYVDFSDRDAENVAVTAVRCDRPLVAPGEPVEVRAELRNFVRQAHDRQPVELLVDGVRVKQEHVALAPGGEAAVAFSCRLEAGDHALEVRAEGDALDVDNHRFLVIPVRRAVRVLCVDGRASGETSVGGDTYLSMALAPRRGGNGPSLIHPTVVPESGLAECRLADYDCVMLSDVAQFTPGEAKSLDGYLKGGGGLVFFLGDRVLAANYNGQLGGGNPNGVRVLPARLGEVVAQPAGRLDPLEYQHPIVRPFRSREKAGLLTTPVFKHFRLLIPQGSKAQRVLALPGGDPLIVEERVHRGRVILVATSADTSWGGDWTPMPLWPSFLPLVHEMLASALGGQLQQRNLLVGEPLGGSFAIPRAGAPFSVRRPDGRRQQGQLQADAGDAAWDYAETDRSGLYRVEFGPPMAQSESFAVNVDPVEGDLSTAPEKEMEDRVWPGVTVVRHEDWQRLGGASASGSERPIDLAQAVVFAAIAVLVLETYLARRFGHHAP